MGDKSMAEARRRSQIPTTTFVLSAALAGISSLLKGFTPWVRFDSASGGSCRICVSRMQYTASAPPLKFDGMWFLYRIPGAGHPA